MKPTNEKVSLDPINTEECAQYYKNLLNENRKNLKRISTHQELDFKVENINIQIPVELNETISWMKNRKASGQEGVTAKLLKNGSEKLYRLITGVLKKQKGTYIFRRPSEGSEWV